MAPQRERVLRPGRDEPHGEKGREGVEPVGQREDLSRQTAGDRILGEARQVMLGDRVRHFLRLSVMTGVLAAHDALQRGKLPDHAGHQIGLAELGGLPAMLDGVEVAERIGQFRGQGHDPSRLLM